MNLLGDEKQKSKRKGNAAVDLILMISSHASLSSIPIWMILIEVEFIRKATSDLVVSRMVGNHSIRARNMQQ